MADLITTRARIDEIDLILSKGVTQFSSGEDKTTYDLEALARERDRLMRIVSNSTVSSYRRVVFKSA